MQIVPSKHVITISSNDRMELIFSKKVRVLQLIHNCILFKEHVDIWAAS